MNNYILKFQNSSLFLEKSALLCPLKVADITKEYIDALNDSEVNRFLVAARKEKQTIKTVTNFVEVNEKDSRAVLYGFFYDKKLCGTVRLHDITTDFCTIGILIFDKKLWGKGLGSKIVSLVCRHACQEMDSNYIFAGIDKDNIASRKMFSKSGFERLKKIPDWYSVDSCDLWQFNCDC